MKKEPNGMDVPYFDKDHKIKITRGDGKIMKMKGSGYVLLTSQVTDPKENYPIDIKTAVSYNAEVPNFLMALLDYYNSLDPALTKAVVADFIHKAAQKEGKTDSGIYVPGRN